MRPNASFWTASLALLSITTAEAAPAPQRPRYYYPRHIKRALVNDTLGGVLGAGNSAIGEAASILSAVLDPNSNGGSVASSSPSAVQGQAQPQTQASTGPVPQAQPTTTANPQQQDTTTNVVVVSTVSVQAVPVSNTAPTAQAVDPTTQPTTTSTGLLGAATGLVNTIASVSTSPTATDPTTATTPTATTPTATTPASTTPTTSEPASSSAPTVAASASVSASVDPNLVNPVTSLVSTLLSPSSSVDPNAVVSSAAPLVSSTPPVSASVDPNALVSSVAPTVPISSDPGITVGISTIISNPVSTPASTPTDVPSSAVPPPASSTPVVSVSGTPTDTGVVSSAPVSIAPSSAPPATTTDTGVSASSAPVVISSVPAVVSSAPAVSGDVSSVPASISAPVSVSEVSTTSGPAPTEVSSSAPVIAPQVTKDTTSAAPFSIVPTGSDTATVMSIPTAIMIQPSSAMTNTATTATGIPTSMPKVIEPAGGVPVAPKNTTLVQVGFQHELNYGFVSTNPGSAQQIFAYLPAGVASGLNIDPSLITMQSLQPYDMSKTQGWIMTLALFYVPSDQVNQLAADIHTPNSQLYNNPNPTINTLMNLIVPSIPLVAGQTMSDSDSTTNIVNAQGGPAVSPGTSGGGAPFGGDSSNGSPVSPSAAAIAAPIATGGLLYGAAMVFVARRYRKKRQQRGRTNSYSSGSGSEASGSEYMAGGNERHSHGSLGSEGSSQNRSVRTQQISAPVMTENSLGWN